ncbi:hypothetical protein JX580_11420 [Thiomicrospira microaerophila]|uniref:DUF6858 family protein n=1 Tax=Thiomicrospira microaerophila TaxID=406020 RepID=UPI00200C76CE|nr:hypothetical protein [Thiomicrospira microaerophila]UQB42246.1 hypothetical protein JX580_11420 [Thiomicrospira microaerophila]
MQQTLFKEKYPIYTLSFSKAESKFDSVDAILDDLQQKIEAHPKAVFIALFDHYAHTKSIGGEIGEGILDAKNMILCFGMQLPSPEPVAVRPRSIGVTDMGEHFVVNFMEAPNPIANETMESWVKSLVR